MKNVTIDEIYTFLVKNKGKIFSSNDIANKFKCTPLLANRILRSLLRRKDINMKESKRAFYWYGTKKYVDIIDNMVESND